MNNEIKLKTATVKTRSEMETLIREIAGLKLNEKFLTTNLDAEIQAVRDNYESRLNTITLVLAEKLELARAWAEANPAAFSQRKSLDFLHGLIGFRTGTPKLKPLTKWKWDAVLAALRDSRWGLPYIRVKEEINKEQLLADISARLLDESDLRKVGARVVQEESFFVEPKFARVETREVAKAA